MNYIIYNAEKDQLYVMYLDHVTWNGALYYGSTKLNFNKYEYITNIVGNKNMEFIDVL